MNQWIDVLAADQEDRKEEASISAFTRKDTN